MRARRAIASLGCVVGLLVCAGPARAADRIVNDDGAGQGPFGINCASAAYPSIQAAVDAANPGDRILVCAGNYQAAGGAPAATVSKPLQLIGAQVDVNTGLGSPRGFPNTSVEAVISEPDGGFDVAADSVSVEGFFFTGADAGAAIDLGSNSAGHHVGWNVFGGNRVGISAQLRPGATTVIESNGYFPEYGAAEEDGILVTRATDLAIRNNWIPTLTGRAIRVDASAADPVTGLRIADNGSLGYVQLANARQVAVDNNGINSGFDRVRLDGGNQDVAISRNYFRSYPVAGQGEIELGIDVAPVGNSNVTIERNVIDESIFQTHDGSGVRVEPGSVSGTVTIRQNRFWGNDGGGVWAAAPGGTIAAQNNWWGCNAGPASEPCDGVAGPSAAEVIAEPHLVLTLETLRPVPGPPYGWGSVQPGFTVDLAHSSDGSVLAGGVSQTTVFFTHTGRDFFPNWGDGYSGMAMNDGLAFQSVTNNYKKGTVHVKTWLDGQTLEGDMEMPDWAAVLGECDSINDFFEGTMGDDRIKGTRKPERLSALSGDDTIDGAGAVDCVDGMRGEDRVRGGPGGDYVVGGSGRDRLRGEAGKDVLNSAFGGRDEVSCGPGKDTVIADKRDDVSGCEKEIKPHKPHHRQ